MNVSLISCITIVIDLTVFVTNNNYNEYRY